MKPRPPIDPLLRRAMAVLRHWRTLRWYLLLLVPHLATDAYLGMRLHDPLLAIFTFAVSALLTTVIVVELHTGLTSSNWGTYTRTQHPLRYWAFVCTKCVLYLGMIVVTLQTSHPSPDRPAPSSPSRLTDGLSLGVCQSAH